MSTGEDNSAVQKAKEGESENVQKKLGTEITDGVENGASAKVHTQEVANSEKNIFDNSNGNARDTEEIINKASRTPEGKQEVQKENIGGDENRDSGKENSEKNVISILNGNSKEIKKGALNLGKSVSNENGEGESVKHPLNLKTNEKCLRERNKKGNKPSSGNLKGRSEASKKLEKIKENNFNKFFEKDCCTITAREQCAAEKTKAKIEMKEVEHSTYGAESKPESNRTHDETVSDRDLPVLFSQLRHTSKIEGFDDFRIGPWRLKERDNGCVKKVLRLNFDIAVGDANKAGPAKMKCRNDPTEKSQKKLGRKIGNRPEKQHGHSQTKAIQFRDEMVYRKAKPYECQDPHIDKLRKLCETVEDRPVGDSVLFHYNGHGILPPTPLGEFYIFDETYTMYIPVLIWDVIAWIYPPLVFVFDCSHAERTIECFKTHIDESQTSYEMNLLKSIIILGACSANETLPTCSELPADVFTSCLTTPLGMAIYWHVVVNKCRLTPCIDPKLIDKIPGKLHDRKSMLGELFWIFTAITDTIAWTTVEPRTFRKLYRQDDIIASLFRNYLLAERVMESHNLATVTHPALPCMYRHRLWNTWDYVLDKAIGQLPDIVDSKKPYKHSSFFEDQLTAFDRRLWSDTVDTETPNELPVLLQSLLSGTYRKKAIELLVRYLDLGPRSVMLALSTGIYPYMLQLLQKKTDDYGSDLVFIWAKILAVDTSCQIDVLTETGGNYFVTVLRDHSFDTLHRMLAVVVLASLANNFTTGQHAALENSLITVCLDELTDSDTQIRKWLAICLAFIWDKYITARWTGVRNNAHEKLFLLLEDPCPEVRAAAVFALGTFIHSVHNVSEHAHKINQAIAITLVDKTCGDMSTLVRQQLLCALQWIVFTYESKFTQLAKEDVNIIPTTPAKPSFGRSFIISLPLTATSPMTTSQHLRRTSSIASIGGVRSPVSSSIVSFHIKVWEALRTLEVDPDPKVAEKSAVIMKYIRSRVDKMALPTKRMVVADVASNSETKRPEFFAIREPLIETDFVSWCYKRIAQPLLKKNKPADDPESYFFHEQKWRMHRNNDVRAEAEEEYKVAPKSTSYAESCRTVCYVAPTLLRFHPYEEQMAIASQHDFQIWNFGRKRQLSRFSKQAPAPKKPKYLKKITAIEWINAHDVALIMIGFDDGSVELWRPIKYGYESEYITAWKVFNELTPPSTVVAADVYLAWEQWTHTIVATGPSQVIRLWDAERESHIMNIPTKFKQRLTCIDSMYAGWNNHLIVNSNADEVEQSDKPHHGLIATGYANGTVALYDRRCRPRDALVMSFMMDTDSILTVQLRGQYVLTGCVTSNVRIYDVRNKSLVKTCNKQVAKNVNAFSIHRNADVYAWGTNDGHVNMYNTLGHGLFSTRYPGDYFTRIGLVNCVTYHPHRVLLAAGTANSTVVLYALRQKT